RAVEAQRQRTRRRPRLEVGRGAVVELRLAAPDLAGTGVIGGHEEPRRAAHDVRRRHPVDARLRGPGRRCRPLHEVGALGGGDVPVLGARCGDVVGHVAEEHVPAPAGPDERLVLLPRSGVAEPEVTHAWSRPEASGEVDTPVVDDEDVAAAGPGPWPQAPSTRATMTP